MAERLSNVGRAKRPLPVDNELSKNTIQSELSDISELVESENVAEVLERLERLTTDIHILQRRRQMHELSVRLSNVELLRMLPDSQLRRLMNLIDQQQQNH